MGNNKMCSTRLTTDQKCPSQSFLQELATQNGPRFWEMLTGVFDGLNQGIIIADHRGLVVVFNQTAEQIMGYQATEVVGHYSLWDLCEECSYPPLFRKSLMQGQSFPEEEVEMRSKHPQSITVGVKVKPIYNQKGHLEGALATIRSLDEIQAHEREQKSLVRMAAIGRIISAIAHEINNPLQTVRTSMELALDPRKSQEKRSQYLKAADQEISRISQIIGQMRSFYRPTPGEKQPINLNDKLQVTVLLLKKQLSKARIVVKLELEPNIPEVYLLDYQLEHVFLNLILNAIESMPNGGELIIISHKTEDGQIAISFKDNAANLDKQQLERLFDPLENRNSIGLGIGLSVCQEIIGELNGSIEVCAKAGTTLTVYLPC
jgi:PAS domain S-box-containing protein